MKYISKADSEECIFCKKANEQKDEKNMILFRGKNVFVIMNIYPYNPGHIMIAPYRHTGDINNLSDEEIYEMMKLTQISIDIIEKKMNPQGYNVGINIGRIAGAGFEHHIHIHIVPRWNGDTNFMPIIGETKVIPVSLEETYKNLKDGFDGVEKLPIQRK